MDCFDTTQPFDPAIHLRLAQKLLRPINVFSGSAQNMRIGQIVAVGALAALGIGLTAVPKADAAYIAYLYQDGSNVVATGSGSFDLAGLSFYTSTGFSPNLDPASPWFVTGVGLAYLYQTISGPSNFGSDNIATLASTESGDVVGIGFGGYLYVPPQYVSGEALISSATFDNTTLAAMGVTDGTYTWTWGAGPDADSFTLYAGVAPPASGVPEPASLALLGTGLVGLALKRRAKPTLAPICFRDPASPTAHHSDDFLL